MVLKKLLQLPNPAGNKGSLLHFSSHLDQYGIDHKNAAELLMIATDQQLYYGTHAEFFAMHYALYALGALQSVDACPAILNHLNQLNVDEDEWVDSYIFVFEMMGEQAIPYLIQGCKTVNLESIFVLTESLGKLSGQFPAYREQVLVAFDELLSRIEFCPAQPHALFSGETALLMGWLDMKAVERIDVIRTLDQQNKFDKSYTGYLEEIEYVLGLRTDKLNQSNLYD